jgi:hypothetical protein
MLQMYKNSRTPVFMTRELMCRTQVPIQQSISPHETPILGLCRQREEEQGVESGVIN